MVNADNIRRTVEAIDPKRWHQKYFFGQSACGTSGCLAGWGSMVQFPEKLNDLGDGRIFEAWLYRQHGGPADAAQKFFGLTGNQAEFLFYHWQGEVLPDGFDWEGFIGDDLEKWEGLYSALEAVSIEYTIDNLKRTLTMVTGVTFE